MTNYEVGQPAQAEGKDASEAGWVDDEGVNRISEKAIDEAGGSRLGAENFAKVVAFGEQQRREDC